MSLADDEQSIHDNLERIAMHGAEWRRMVAERDEEIATLRQRLAEAEDFSVRMHKQAMDRADERDALRLEVETLTRRVAELEGAIQQGRTALRGDRHGAYGRLAEADSVLAAALPTEEKP